MNEADYNSIMETLYLQQSFANAKHLTQSMTEADVLYLNFSILGIKL